MAQSFTSALREAYQEAKDPQYATQMSAYMRNLFPFFGIKSPIRKSIEANLIKTHKIELQDRTKEIILQLWNEPEREYQYTAMHIAEKYLKKEPLNKELLAFYEGLILKKSWWDSVDFIAPTLIGRHFLKDQKYIDVTIHKWISSKNIWLVRSAVIFQLKYKHETNADLLFAIILQVKDEREFFIQKAIGWALREYSKVNPMAIKSFIQSTTLAPLSRREGMKHLIRTGFQ